MDVVVISRIRKVFESGRPNETIALDDVSLTISKGEFLAIMGVSGSGKSTLMHILGCLDTPTSGTYLFDGENITEKRQRELVTIRRKKIGFIFQTFNLLPRTTSIANVELPLIYQGIGMRERKRRAIEALNQVGLSDRLTNTPAKLSGGQQQRVAIARAIIHHPTLILADEPTGNLDSKSGGEIMDVLKKLNAQGSTIVVVTHDQAIAQRAHRTIKLVDGRIV